MSSPQAAGMNSCSGKSTWEWGVLPEEGVSRSPERVKQTSNKNTALPCAEHPTCVLVVSYRKAATLNQFVDKQTELNNLTSPRVT